MKAIDSFELKAFDGDGVAVLLTSRGGEHFADRPFCPHQEGSVRKGHCDGEFITCFEPQVRGHDA
jgi:nitrite reductase/ring-hydroxylating ferredoxin subunit